jgi:pyrimidine-nucleoside phosphorylase
LSSGAGVEKFRQIIEHQGGDPRVIDDYRRLPAAPDRALVAAPRDGFITGLQAELVGRAAVALGAGRNRVDESVDHAVGVRVLVPRGRAVRSGDAVFEVHHRGGRGLGEASTMLRDAISMSDAPPSERPLILGAL